MHWIWIIVDCNDNDYSEDDDDEWNEDEDGNRNENNDDGKDNVSKFGVFLQMPHGKIYNLGSFKLFTFVRSCCFVLCFAVFIFHIRCVRLCVYSSKCKQRQNVPDSVVDSNLWKKTPPKNSTWYFLYLCMNWWE